MTRNVAIIGAGFFAAELADLIDNDFNYYFVTHNPEEVGLGKISECDYLASRRDPFVVAVGDVISRDRIYTSLTTAGCASFSYSHPSASISKSASIDSGSIIYQNVVLQACCRIGVNSFLNAGVTLGHHVSIGRSTILQSGCVIGGKVEIGDLVFLGMGCLVAPGVSISSGSVVGANSFVADDIIDPGLYVGTPARKKD